MADRRGSMEEEKTMTVYQQLQLVAEEICDKYCRYTNTQELRDISDDYDINAFHEKYCNQCPLNRLF